MNEQYDLICFSHLRWEFVFQRPQHLLSRAARDRRVFYVEEPLREPGPAGLSVRRSPEGVMIVQPIVPRDTAPADEPAIVRSLVDDLLAEFQIERYALWFYTPMALPLAHHLQPIAVVYDCMDELTGFLGAPAGLAHLELQLMAGADVMFTGGRSLYQAKRGRHPNLHAFPSAVDVPHFAQARAAVDEPADQAAIPHPRVGFFGVIDERLDIALLDAVARLRPDLELVMIGPVVKIDPATLPQAPNIHWLGGKSYAELPRYIAGWDVAILPFARNAATRFISPTKTPEYLAAGRPVVSTSITDVVHPYGELGLARIADAPLAFAAALDAALAEDAAGRLRRADRWLEQMSWDRTWAEMDALIDAAIELRAEPRADTGEVPVMIDPAELEVGAA
jgi:UDP-galactopyranose mutase